MMNFKKQVIASAIFLGAALAAHSVVAANDMPSWIQNWTLGAPSHWDYIDIDVLRHRLFLCRGDHVQVLDLPSGNVTGDIPNTNGVHGIAFAQDLKLGFASNGKANSVTVFDLDTLAVKQEIKVSGVNPDAILYDQQSRQLYTFNGKTANVTVIDVNSLQVVATIATTGKPEFAVNNGNGKIFFNVEDKAEIHTIDIVSNKLIAKWPLSHCEEPTGLAMDIKNDRLFSVCQNNTMVVTDATTGKQVASVTIGGHPDAAVYDADLATIYSSNGEGSLSVIKQIDANHYSAATNVKTVKGARTMAMDKASKIIYLPAIIDKQFTVMSYGNK
ncbi:YncE family protein [Undibacterium sp. SXout11W]|uniref:YncE family protein n=1 Tax=Undibacterium sp. SXout11W TaxID=3413050 RepID=UPI003BF1A3BB